jgi:large subunit ribosomal protein L21
MSDSRYAVIQAQGLQFRVQAEEEHILPHMGAEPGAEVTFDRVLLISDAKGVQIGKPVVEGAAVTARVLGTERGPKVTVGVFKRRKKFRKKTGFRATLTRVKILAIRG